MKTLKFLGTAGARFVMLKQLRASGGLWLCWDDTSILIDPGPGSLVKCLRSRPKLEPSKLDGIILTHRHLDHSGDINVMIEAMTNGGLKKKGVVFAPRDALDDDPVILKYNRNFVDKIEVLKENKTYKIKSLSFQTSVEHIHDCQTYGLNFIDGSKVLLSLIADTQYFKSLEEKYSGEILVINVVRHEPKEGVKHLDVDGVKKILSKTKARVCILTHFGMTMLKSGPFKIAEDLQNEFKNVKVIAAYDGMTFKLEED
ncbi:MAG: MBL fold metallo-hydrolase [Candidatus Omnitrophica bacterium]|nr:MBL fold metallo-hydrolase [Candidatus Omnitrophota bacterium]